MVCDPVMESLLKVHIGEGKAVFLASKTIAIGDVMTVSFSQPFFSTLIRNGLKEIILDLSSCIYVDSAGTGTLVESFTACMRKGGTFLLNRPRPMLRDYLAITKLDRVFTITDVDYSSLQYVLISPLDLLAQVSGVSIANPIIPRGGLFSRLKIFLCHASEDKPRIRDLHMRLRDDGYYPWLDEEDLLPGQVWEKEIPKAVRNSHIVIVALSKKAISKSGYVQKEISYALDVAEEQPEGSIFIIPLKLEECDVPDRLKRWQWVNLFEKKGYDRLFFALSLRSCKL